VVVGSPGISWVEAIARPGYSIVHFHFSPVTRMSIASAGGELSLTKSTSPQTKNTIKNTAGMALQANSSRPLWVIGEVLSLSDLYLYFHMNQNMAPMTSTKLTPHTMVRNT
jgi:hypothetical protein